MSVSRRSRRRSRCACPCASRFRLPSPRSSRRPSQCSSRCPSRVRLDFHDGVRLDVSRCTSRCSSRCRSLNLQIRVSAQIRVSYNLRRTQVRLHRSLDVCVVVASTLVVIVLGAVGGALQFLLAVLSEDVDYSFRGICFQYSVFEKNKKCHGKHIVRYHIILFGYTPCCRYRCHCCWFVAMPAGVAACWCRSLF